MKLRLAQVIGIGLVVLGAGCSKHEESVDSGYDKIGVEECDAYFKAAEVCMRKDPSRRATMEPSMKQNHEVWKKYAQTQQQKDALKVGCKAASSALAAQCQ